MTTSTWADAVEHTSDADFRSWGSKVSTELQNCGLVKTSDTGQIDWTTVTRPAANTVGGYEIYYLNDSLHATSPVYLKLEYGSGGNIAYPMIWLTVGQGSNGSGTLTGQLSTRTQCCANTGTSSGSFPSYVSVTGGLVFLGRRSGAMSTGSAQGRGVGGFIVARTCDDDGTLNGTGVMIICGSSSSTQGSVAYQQSMRLIAPAETFDQAGNSTANGANFFNLPGSQTNTSVDGDTQATIGLIPTPRHMPVKGVGVAMTTELSVGSTATIQFFAGGPTSTYLQAGITLGSSAARKAPADDSLVGYLVLWE